MSDKPDSFMPKWTGGATNSNEIIPLPKGYHIVAVKIIGGEWRDAATDKPFALLTWQIGNTEHRQSESVGFRFQARQYFSQTSEGWARYMLIKMGYPEEEMQKDRPNISMKKIIGLSGEAVVRCDVDPMGMRRYELKGYSRPGEGELDEKLPDIIARDEKKAADGNKKEAEEAEPEVDINDDVKNEVDPRSALNDLD